MRTLLVLALLAGCASKKPEPKAAGAPPAAAEPRKETKDSTTDKDSAPTETKRKSDPCEGGQ